MKMLCYTRSQIMDKHHQVKALIIENSRLYRQLLDIILGQHGFDNDIAVDYRMARHFLDTHHYDVICLNEVIEGGSGIELVRYCRYSEALRDIPILFFSADDDIQARLNGFHVDGIILKHNLQQISDQIVNFLETRYDTLFGEGRILLVEDSDSIANMILSALGQAGYKVERFESAEDAWREFNGEVSYGSDDNAYDLVITDVNVAGAMNGRQLTQKIRGLSDARGFVPITAITSDQSDQLRLALYRAGVNDFIPKPILIEELLVRVSNLITNKRLLDKVHDQRRELFALATTDKLTGCHNRHSLMEFAGKFIAQAIRHRFPVSLMVLDLDHFKQVNDQHGHATGDEVLAATGNLLNGSFREGDMVARFGGEEFVVLLNHCDQRDAVLIAEKFRHAIAQLEPAGLKVSASIGVTTLAPGHQLSFENLFAAADEGVYQAKENGRNQVRFVAPDRRTH
jgi:two-component system cell cycle response regulator